MTSSPAARVPLGLPSPPFLSPSAKLSVHRWAEDALARTREEGTLGVSCTPHTRGWEPAVPCGHATGERGRVCLTLRGGTGVGPLPTPSAELPHAERLWGRPGSAPSPPKSSAGAGRRCRLAA